MVNILPLQIFSFIAFLLHIPILIWYIKIKNIPASCLSTWFILLSLNTFISTTMWSSSDLMNWWNGVIFCDIVVRIMAGCNSGVLCATTAVARNLSIIMSNNGPKLGFNSFRARIIDLLICLLLPVILMALEYIVQIRRYYIYQYQGCILKTASSWASIAVVAIWPPIISLITSAYVILTLARYYVKRRDAKDVLHCSGSGMTIAKFVRFFAFCTIVIGIVVPYTLFVLVMNIKGIEEFNVPFDWNLFHSHSWSTILTALTDGPSTQQIIDCVLAYVGLICFGTGQDMGEWYLHGLDIIKIGWIFRKIGEYFNSLKGKVMKKKERNENRFSSSTTEFYNNVFSTRREIELPKEINNQAAMVYFSEEDPFEDSYSAEMELEPVPITPNSITSRSNLINHDDIAGKGSTSKSFKDSAVDMKLPTTPVPIIGGVPYKSKEWNTWNHMVTGGDRESSSSSSSSQIIDPPSRIVASSSPPIPTIEEYRVSYIYSSREREQKDIV